jgi:hypothetical protein
MALANLSACQLFLLWHLKVITLEINIFSLSIPFQEGLDMKTVLQQVSQ